MNQDVIRVTGDTTSLFTIVATLAGWLPKIAALLSIVWYVCLFYEKYIKK